MTTKRGRELGCQGHGTPEDLRSSQGVQPPKHRTSKLEVMQLGPPSEMEEGKGRQGCREVRRHPRGAGPQGLGAGAALEPPGGAGRRRPACRPPRALGQLLQDAVQTLTQVNACQERRTEARLVSIVPPPAPHAPSCWRWRRGRPLPACQGCPVMSPDTTGHTPCTNEETGPEQAGTLLGRDQDPVSAAGGSPNPPHRTTRGGSQTALAGPSPV